MSGSIFAERNEANPSTECSRHGPVLEGQLRVPGTLTAERCDTPGFASPRRFPTVVFDGRTPQRVILIEFANMADAQRWRSSPEAQKLKSLQQKSSSYIESFAIEGVQ
jgi:heme-degrading monooxygenase HmoA